MKTGGFYDFFTAFTNFSKFVTVLLSSVNTGPQAVLFFVLLIREGNKRTTAKDS